MDIKECFEKRNFFNNLRLNRHEIFYGFEEDVSKEDVEEALKCSEDFIMEIKKIINS